MGTGGRKINNKHVNNIINKINNGLSALEGEIGGALWEIKHNGTNYELIAFDKKWILKIEEYK